MKQKFTGKRWSDRKAGLVSDGAYDAASTGGEALALWYPTTRSADSEMLPNRQRVTARARDLERNNGWATGGVQKELDAVIGSTFRPIPKPDHVALGLNPDWATEWRQKVQAQWRSYADDPRCYADAARQLTVSQNLGLAYRHAWLDGDAIGVLQWNPDRPNATVLRVVDPELLSNPNDSEDTEFMRGGVEIDSDGAALAYHFRQGHERDIWANAKSHTWNRVARERSWGRPIVLHWFEKKRDGQTRGMSRLAPIVEKLKMEDKYSRVELEAAALNAIMAAIIKSPFDHTMLSEVLGGDSESLGIYQDMRSASAKENAITLGGVQIPRLFPGEDLSFHKAQRPASGFAEFEGAVLRNIASGLGISYEQLAADWSKTNYSSARAALIEIWRGWTGKRVSFAQRFAQPLFMAWMEEQIDRGALTLPAGAPDFYENWHAYSRAKWIGPGKGFVDPVKEAQAAAMRIALGLSTMEDEAAELTGADLDDNLAQIKREIEALPENMLHPAQESFAKLIGHNGTPPAENANQ